MFDYHVHSTVSFDAHSDMVDCARRAAEIGMTEICFTEHHEFDYPYEDVKPHLDFARYFREIERARAEVPQIKIKTGAEVALVTPSLQRIADDLAVRELDFVLASQHVVQGKDPWYGDYFAGITLREGQQRYLQEILTNISVFDDFDCVAHIGYIDKYLDSFNGLSSEIRPFTYKDFPTLIDDILNVVINKGKGVEVNTSNYYIHGYPTPHVSIIKRYVELGGEVMTIGSDAHSADVIGHEFTSAYALLRECGVRYLCTFDKRKPEFIKL